MKKFVFYVFIGMIGIVPVFYANAQQDDFKSAAHEVSESVERLLIYGDRATDFELRKKALLAVFSLTAIELRDAEQRITKVDAHTEKALTDVQVSLRDSLDYLEQELLGFQKQADAALYTDEVKVFASRFKSWRDSQYNPTIRKSLDLGLVLRSRIVLSLADERIKKIVLDVAKLEKVFGAEANPLQTELTLAKEALAHAHSLYDDARDAFFAKYEGAQAPDMHVITGSMISAVKKTYQIFFNMSAIAQKLLGEK